MRLFDFTPAAPPTDEQLREIAEHLLTSLCNRFDVGLKATEVHIEPGSWVTMKIRSSPLLGPLIDMVFVGIISFSLRAGAPSVESVLLTFSKGKRVSVGRNTILVANYVDGGNGENWEDFNWCRDEFGEWECDELPNRQLRLP